MDLDTFLNKVEIYDSGIISDSSSMLAFEDMIRTRSRAVSYTYSSSFVVNNIGVMQVSKDGFHTFSVGLVTGSVDIVSEITSNVPCEILLDDLAFTPNNPIVVCNGLYTEKKIRFYIDPNNVPDRVILTYKIVLLNTELRRELINVPILYSGETVCTQGVISRR